MSASLPAAQACRGGQGRLEPAAAATSCGFQHMQPQDACTQDHTYAHTCVRVLSSACVEMPAASMSYHLFQARFTQGIATEAEAGEAGEASERLRQFAPAYMGMHACFIKMHLSRHLCNMPPCEGTLRPPIQPRADEQSS